MAHNNEIIFGLGLFFFLLASFSPIIAEGFNQNNINTYNTDVLEEGIEQTSFLNFTNNSTVLFLSGLLVWVFGAPWWLNIFIIIFRVIFWVVIYDKFRGMN